MYKPANYMLGMHFWRGEGVFDFAGRLFWFDLSCGIIAWDDDDPFDGVENEKERARCRFIPLPEGSEKPFNTPKLEDERGIFGSGECIHYIDTSREGDHWLKVWRLKDYKSSVNEWNMVYKVPVDSYLDLMKKPLLRSCFFHPFEVDTVFFETGDRIFSYNFLTRNVETTASFTEHKFVIPFVLPCWPTSLPPRLCKWLFYWFVVL